MTAARALVLAAILLASPARAEEADATLDTLFAVLAAPSSTQAEARAAQEEIEARWFVPPETGVGILFDRAVTALNDRDPALAVVLTGHVTGLAPSFAEGWVLAGHARAAAGQPQDAMRAYAEAVRLEPRHYAALARLGDLAFEAGDRRAALSRYREALLVNPHLAEVRERADRLRDEVRPGEI